MLSARKIVRAPQYQRVARRAYIANRLLGGTVHNSTVVAVLAAVTHYRVSEHTVRMYIRAIPDPPGLT